MPRLLQNSGYLIIGRFIPIVFGVLIIENHNVWEPNWTVIITLIGWCALLLGLSLFIFPQRTVNWLNFVNIKFVQILYMLLFLIGIFLLSMAYGFIFV